MIAALILTNLAALGLLSIILLDIRRAIRINRAWARLQQAIETDDRLINAEKMRDLFHDRDGSAL